MGQEETCTYILSFLTEFYKDSDKICYYGKNGSEPESAKIIVVSSCFFNDGIYGTKDSMPRTPFSLLSNPEKTPILFGIPKEEYKNGKIIVYADIVASSYFLLSRYEEMIKPHCRDTLYGRFLAKDSIVFQQGYGQRPIVDEYGRYLRNLLRKIGVDILPEHTGFSKIWLTHDIDVPFRFYKLQMAIKQEIKNIIHYGEKIQRPLYTYFNEQNDVYYTFPQIIKYDNDLKREILTVPVIPMYFIIALGDRNTKAYCNILSKKFSNLLYFLKENGSQFGLHISLEGGENPEKIINDIRRYRLLFDEGDIRSRHHCLKWMEPAHVEQMEQYGITDDFTLEYADSIGFRVGTCHPYRFLNPKTRRLTKVIIHPMEIMECSLDRSNYMNLQYKEAFDICCKLIDRVYEYNGELVLLWHNTSFYGLGYQKDLYQSLLQYIKDKVSQ